jgi:mannose-6-phosphate isomerase
LRRVRLSRDALRGHLLDELLPHWERYGLDRERGGYWNRLGPGMRPEPDEAKRFLVHTRQLYAFSRGSELGAGDWARRAALHGLDFMQRRFWDARHGGWFFTTDLAGQPLDRRKDLYVHAFAIFALAHHYRAFGESESLRLARETLAIVRDKLRDAKHGGFWEGASEDWQPDRQSRAQNPHMHLVEALLALHEVSPEDGALEEAEALVALLEARWVQTNGALVETFASDWRRHPAGRARRVEPGHGFEWTWLLHRYVELGGRGNALQVADRLYRFARHYGVDDDQGVFDTVDLSGRPGLTTKRLWPQTERIKALSALARHRPDPSLRTELEAALAYCGARHIDRENGGWHEQLARDGTVLSEGQNATSVYHVVFALSEALRAIEHPLVGAAENPG